MSFVVNYQTRTVRSEFFLIKNIGYLMKTFGKALSVSQKNCLESKYARDRRGAIAGSFCVLSFWAMTLSRPVANQYCQVFHSTAIAGMGCRVSWQMGGAIADSRVVSCFQRILYGLRRRIISHPFGINVLSEYRRPSHCIAQQRVLMVLSLGLEFQLIRPKMGMF